MEELEWEAPKNYHRAREKEGKISEISINIIKCLLFGLYCKTSQFEFLISSHAYLGKNFNLTGKKLHMHTWNMGSI